MIWLCTLCGGLQMVPQCQVLAGVLSQLTRGSDHGSWGYLLVCLNAFASTYVLWLSLMRRLVCSQEGKSPEKAPANDRSGEVPLRGRSLNYPVDRVQYIHPPLQM